MPEEAPVIQITWFVNMLPFPLFDPLHMIPGYSGRLPGRGRYNGRSPGFPDSS